jgi:hypothetical protein
MRLLAVLTVLVFVFGLLAVQASARTVKQVEVTNFPDLQNVVGQVEVTNLPTPPTVGWFQLVGFTVATFMGDQGVFGFTRACQGEFSGSRMCTSVEVMRTVSPPVLPAGSAAWVQPELVASSGATSTVDASGITGAISGLSCWGWKFARSTMYGLTVDHNGRFSGATETTADTVSPRCDVPKSVACCAPVL